MVKKQTFYEARFKSQVVLEVLRGKKTMLEICAENKVSKQSVAEWREKLMNGIDGVFMPEHEKKKEVNQLKQKVESLHKIIGEITVENKFFKKKLVV